MIPLIIASSLMLLAGTASAQGVYRCGNTFSEHPCGPNAMQIVAPPATPTKLERPADISPQAAQIEANKAVCEKKTRAAMKDPESTKIKSVSRAGTSLQRLAGQVFYGISYDMNVNAKNSYGGYTGEKLYNCVFSLDEKTFLGIQEIAPWPN